MDRGDVLATDLCGQHPTGRLDTVGFVALRGCIPVAGDGDKLPVRPVRPEEVPHGTRVSTPDRNPLHGHRVGRRRCKDPFVIRYRSYRRGELKRTNGFSINILKLFPEYIPLQSSQI